MKNKYLIIIGLFLAIAVIAVSMKATTKASYLESFDGNKQHIIMTSGDLQLQIKQLSFDSSHVNFEYAVMKNGELLEGYEVNLIMPDVYDKPILLTPSSYNTWQAYQENTVNDLHKSLSTQMSATISKEGKKTTFRTIDIDLSTYNISYIGDIVVNQTMMLNDCSVTVEKLHLSKENLELYYTVKDTDKSFVSYLHFNLYTDNGKKYRTSKTQWIDPSVKIAKFDIDDAFGQSASLKLEINQANVTNILDVYDYTDEDLAFEYQEIKYNLNKISHKDKRINFELVCTEEKIPVFPELLFRSKEGWEYLSTEISDDTYTLSAVFIPSFIEIHESDYSSAAQGYIDFAQQYTNITMDLDAIASAMPILYSKDVKVYIDENGTLLNPLKQSIMAFEDVLEIGLASPNDIHIITESITVNLE